MARRLTQAMSFFMTTTMFEEIQKVSEEREVSASQLLRSLIKDFLHSEGKRTIEADGWLKDQEESSQRKNDVQSQTKEKIQ